MKKFLAVILLAGLVFVGAEAALASIPHVHGTDTDHSSHKGCPVHQFAASGLSLDVTAPVSPVFGFQTTLLYGAASPAPPSFAFPLSSSRAPPSLI